MNLTGRSHISHEPQAGTESFSAAAVFALKKSRPSALSFTNYQREHTSHVISGRDWWYSRIFSSRIPMDSIAAAQGFK